LSLGIFLKLGFRDPELVLFGPFCVLSKISLIKEAPSCILVYWSSQKSTTR